MSTESNKADAVNEAAAHSYDFFGDCIGLSPQIYGNVGPYVQSDMQFAQQVVEDIRAFDGRGFNEDTLMSELSMAVGTRFFYTPQDGMVASQLIVDYGMQFGKLIEEVEALAAKGAQGVGDAFGADRPDIPAQNHGHLFKQMYS